MAKYGWCLSEQHRDCKKQVGTLKACDCYCHAPAKVNSRKLKRKS